jgi:hypothetical protein
MLTDSGRLALAHLGLKPIENRFGSQGIHDGARNPVLWNGKCLLPERDVVCNFQRVVGDRTDSSPNSGPFPIHADFTSDQMLTMDALNTYNGGISC